MNAYVKYDRIECRLGTYVAMLRTRPRFANVTAARDYAVAARRVVVAWKRPEFKGASFYAVPLSGTTPLAVSLNEVCAMFEVSASSRKGSDARVVAPVKIELPPVVAKVEPLRPVVYTIGYDHGLTPSRLLAIMSELGLGAVVDTRATLVTRVPGWSSDALAKFLGPQYSVAQTLDDVCRRVARLPGCILIRKEEAPGDNQFHLEIARTLASTCTVLHLFREETVEGVELQRAIDEDTEYDCDLDEVAATAGKAVA